MKVNDVISIGVWIILLIAGFHVFVSLCILLILSFAISPVFPFNCLSICFPFSCASIVPSLLLGSNLHVSYVPAFCNVHDIASYFALEMSHCLCWIFQLHRLVQLHCSMWICNIHTFNRMMACGAAVNKITQIWITFRFKGCAGATYSHCTCLQIVQHNWKMAFNMFRLETRIGRADQTFRCILLIQHGRSFIDMTKPGGPLFYHKWCKH